MGVKCPFPQEDFSCSYRVSFTFFNFFLCLQDGRRNEKHSQELRNMLFYKYGVTLGKPFISKMVFH